MVDKFKHLRIVDEGQIVTCYLSNPPTHTLTAEGVIEIHKFLDIMEAKKDLRVLAFTGDGDEVFIKHYEVGELAETAEKNLNKVIKLGSRKISFRFKECLLYRVWQQNG